MTVHADNLPTADSLRSLVEGMGEPATSKTAMFGRMGWTLTDGQLANAYRNVWMARKIVDIPAFDALRKWRDWQADQDQITLLEREEKRLGLKQKLLQTKVLARLWGGACLYIGTGEDPSSPLDPETVGKGGLKYLTVMSRREMIAGELEQDPLSEFYGWPKDYTVSNGRTFATIHPSRLVIQVGNPLPDPWNAVGVHPGWGDSSLQAAFGAITNVDSTAANIAALVFEANVDVFKVPGLMEHMASSAYRTKLLNRFELANAGKSITKALLTDSEEEMERKQVTFAGLPDVLQQFLIVVSGAADIPLTRFIGQSPSGLNATGEHDMKNYHDRVASIQTLEIDPATHVLTECLIRSALGTRPDEVFYTWSPLEQMSEKEQAEIAKLKAETTTMYVNSGLFMPEELREVAANQLVEDGVYPGLGDLVKANGNELEEFDLEREAANLAVEGQGIANQVAANPPEPITDGDTFRTLYMARPVTNAEAILAHYRDQGLEDLLDASDLHATIVYSKMPVNWMDIGDPWQTTLTVPASGLRVTQVFGPEGEEDTLVLRFNSPELRWRHDQAREAGATHDFTSYQPHVSIGKVPLGFDPETIEPWTGAIELGPEFYEDVKA